MGATYFSFRCPRRRKEMRIIIILDLADILFVLIVAPERRVEHFRFRPLRTQQADHIPLEVHRHLFIMQLRFEAVRRQFPF